MTCRDKPRQSVIRHDSTSQALATGLRSLAFAIVEHEPHTAESCQRNDIRVCGAANFGRDINYDVKVYLLLAESALRTTTQPAKGVLTVDHTRTRCINFLNQIAARTDANRLLAPGGFKPLAFLTGGFMAKSTLEEILRWRPKIGKVAWSRILGNIS